MQFTKKDLKTGMGVEFRNGSNAVVMLDTTRGDTIVNVTGQLPLSYFKDDLNSSLSGFDVVKVYNMYSHIFSFLKTGRICGEVIWERKETKEITPEEACKIIKEKCGEDVVIKL